MRILLVSDLHYRLKQLDWVTSVAADYELVIVAGDLPRHRLHRRTRRAIAVVLEYLSRFATQSTVVACSGNHDLNAPNEHGERAAVWLGAAGAAGVFVDGTHVDTETVMVTVCPWWDGPQTREVVARQLAHDAALLSGRRWIWVYHAPPDASPTSWTGKRHYGDEDLAGWIGEYGPDIVLCGHVHQSPFVADGAWLDRIGSTWVMNAGQQPGPVPTHIALDTEARTARWSSYEGIDERSLV